VHVVQLAEEVLGLLQSGDETSGARNMACNRLEQIAEPFDTYPRPVRLPDVCGFANPCEVICQLGSLLLNQFPRRLSERQLPLTGAGPDLDMESGQSLSKLGRRLREPKRDLSGSRIKRLILPLFQAPDKPEKPLHVLDSQALLLLAQPGEVDFGVSSSIGCQGQLSQALTHLVRHAALELSAIATDAASKAPEAHPKIVQRLGIARIRHPFPGGVDLAEVTQSD
jgi:hypothetical protein